MAAVPAAVFCIGNWTFLLRFCYGETSERLPRRSPRRRRVGRLLQNVPFNLPYVSLNTTRHERRSPRRRSLRMARAARQESSTRPLGSSGRVVAEVDAAAGPERTPARRRGNRGLGKNCRRIYRRALGPGG